MSDINTKQQLLQEARRMRKSPTNAEQILWKYLRKRQLLGYKFRRQHVIQGYIADFYCPNAKLIIELDGEIHAKQIRSDLQRDRILSELGYLVLHFTNVQVEVEVNTVLKKIIAQLNSGYIPFPS